VSDLRRNVLALGLDYGLFMVGLAFASQTTILPAFAAWLGAPNIVIGAIPAVMTLGWFLPQLFMAAHTATLPRKLPFVIRWTLFERLPFPALALVAFLLAERSPALALTLTLLMLLMTTVIGGVLMPAWLDVIGHAVPAGLQGRLFGLSALGAGLLGFGASALTAYALATLPPSAGYGLCFVGATVCMVLSYIALLYVREPPGGPVAAPVALRAHLARVPGLLRRDRNLSWFLAARACAIVGQMAVGFYTVYALSAWEAPASQPAVFTGLLVAGTVAGTLAFAWLADHAGHRLVILAGMAATFAANVTALASPTLSAYGLVLVLAGVQQAAFSVSNMPVLLEFSPSADERPIYVGLGTTSLAPIAFAAPLAAGLLADALGFRAVFGVATVGSVVGLTMLATLVRDPRTVARPAVESRA
jgi:MFS family permease